MSIILRELIRQVPDEGIPEARRRELIGDLMRAERVVAQCPTCGVFELRPIERCPACEDELSYHAVIP